MKSMKSLVRKLEETELPIEDTMGDSVEIVTAVLDSINEVQTATEVYDQVCAYETIFKSGELVSPQVIKLMKITGVAEIVDHFNGDSKFIGLEDNSSTKSDESTNGNIVEAKKGIFKRILEAIQRFLSKVGEYISKIFKRMKQWLVDAKKVIEVANKLPSDSREFIRVIDSENIDLTPKQFMSLSYIDKIQKEVTPPTNKLIKDVNKTTSDINKITPEWIKTLADEFSKVDSLWTKYTTPPPNLPDTHTLASLGIRSKQHLLNFLAGILHVLRGCVDNTEDYMKSQSKYKQMSIALTKSSDFGSGMDSSDRANIINSFMAQTVGLFKLKIDIDQNVMAMLRKLSSAIYKIASVKDPNIVD